MDRRDALKSLTTLAAATGMQVTPVTIKDAEQCALVVFKVKGHLTMETVDHIKATWERLTEDTPFAGVKAMVIDDGIDVEFVRR